MMRVAALAVFALASSSASAHYQRAGTADDRMVGYWRGDGELAGGHHRPAAQEYELEAKPIATRSMDPLGGMALLKRAGELVDIQVPKRNRRYCGEQLVSTLRLACQKAGRRRKRESPQQSPLAWERQLRQRELSERETEQIVLEGMAQAFRNMMMGLPQRELPKHVNKRGLSDACCTNACSWSTLVSFCN